MKKNNKTKVIYIDDEIVNLKLFEMNFHSHYDLSVCEYPKEALKIIKKENIQIIVTDFKMPEMDGMELIQEVKKNNKNAICIILTGFLESEILIDHSIIYKFMTKPYGSKEVMISVLDEAINRSRLPL